MSKSSPGQPYEFNIESPLRHVVYERTVLVRGWIIVDINPSQVKLRVKNAGEYHILEYGIERPDVMKSRPNIPHEKAFYSGFEVEFEFADGPLSLEVDIGNGFNTIYDTTVYFSAEKTFDSYYNPHLAERLAEHQTVLQNTQEYYHEDGNEGHFKASSKDPKLIAFYLPQFHPIPENDLAWGRGFTEWTNVTLAQARFVGHRQQILPADLGFYDLRTVDTIGQQIDLAKKNGIYGFCFYYYWFSGRKLLEKPLEAFLRRKEWDFNFMICWANENWTKRWDGREEDVIISQKYLTEDPLNFIKDVEGILLDPRYIRNNNKPMLAVYRGSELDDPRKYTDVWRKYFKARHSLDLEIVTMLNFDTSDPRPYGFDAGIEFAPLTYYRHSNFQEKYSRVKDIGSKLLDLDFMGKAIYYRNLSSHTNKDLSFNFPTYPSLSPSWDNESRKKGKGSFTLHGSNPDLYGEWLDATIGGSASNIIFLNAWNEWAEGAVLEPTRHFGYGYLNRTVEVLSRYSQNMDNQKKFPLYGVVRESETAIIIHVNEEKQWEAISRRLLEANIPSDLFITVIKNVEHLIPQIKRSHPRAILKLVPNMGGDVLPFVVLLKRLTSLGYRYILKMHTVETSSSMDELEESLRLLVPSDEQQLKSFLNYLDSGVALTYRINRHNLSDKQATSSCREVSAYLEQLYGAKTAETFKLKDTQFSGEVGFWFRVDALSSINRLSFIPEDFEVEKFKANKYTVGLVWSLIHAVLFIEGYRLQEILQNSSLNDVNSVREGIRTWGRRRSRR